MVDGFGVSLMREACVGTAYTGAVYREVCDGNGPSMINYAAYCQASNDNPALPGFISLFQERYPALPAGD